MNDDSEYQGFEWRRDEMTEVSLVHSLVHMLYASIEREKTLQTQREARMIWERNHPILKYLRRLAEWNWKGETK